LTNYSSSIVITEQTIKLPLVHVLYVY